MSSFVAALMNVGWRMRHARILRYQPVIGSAVMAWTLTLHGPGSVALQVSGGRSGGRAVDGVHGADGAGSGAGGWLGQMWPVLLLGGLFVVTAVAERRRR